MYSTRIEKSLLIKSLITAALLVATATLRGKEGMWVPATLKAHAAELRAEGLEIPVDKLYNDDGTGLNNAIVLFGRGCTGELVSPNGLILTNHHCGYGSVQGLSGPGKDYFANGFFAMSRKDELPCPGLTVTFIRRMENVSGRILKGISDTLNDKVRDSIIAIRVKTVEKEFAAKTHLEAMIKPYFQGNQYWVTIMETYRDIRLVGFPPNGIGAFGGDVENWMWPRHTGDFSMFRVYAGAGNKPAGYAASNQPYRADEFFTINISGYKEGNFTMVYGFPGYTQEYISSHELKQVYSISDPISIDARTQKLDVWTRYMSGSRDIFLKYTAKRAGVANGWKKWQGEVLGLKMNDVAGRKEAYEKTFQQWADRNGQLPYAKKILPDIAEATTAAVPYLTTEQYIRECPYAIELVQQGANAERLINCFRLHRGDKALSDTLKKLAAGMAGFYKNYDAATDKDVFIKLMALYFTKCPGDLPEYYKTAYRAHDQDIAAWASDVYNTSLLTSQVRLEAFAADAKEADSNRILDDPAWLLYSSMEKMRKEKITPALKEYYAHMHYLDRLYMKARMAKDRKNVFYPDANLTLRLACGKVKGMDPDGPASYSYQTNLSEVVGLDDRNSDIFRVPQKLKDLYAAKDYGRWGEKDIMPVAFIATNHTSGGNSGSPVLNVRGELIGINFDRAYEGTMSDYYFDPARCRNITVDIRYVLFVIDKFGGAGWLTDEMKIVRNKQ